MGLFKRRRQKVDLENDPSGEYKLVLDYLRENPKSTMDEIIGALLDDDHNMIPVSTFDLVDAGYVELLSKKTESGDAIRCYELSDKVKK